MSEVEPAIVAWGRDKVDHWPTGEYAEAIWRAFERDGADYIILDSNPWGQTFLAAATAWGIDNGYLYCDRCQTGDQEQIATFRLTTEGKKLCQSLDRARAAEVSEQSA